MTNLVCDFETNNLDKTIWLIGSIDRYNLQIYHHLTLDNWWEWLSSLKNNLTIYFHNLTFDISFLIEFFSKKFTWEANPQRVYHKTNSCYAVINEFTNFYKVIINNGDQIITFKDSLKLINHSVAQISKNLFTDLEKQKLDYDLYRHYEQLVDVPIIEIKYINNDLLIVAKTLNYLKFDRYLTSASYAYKQIAFAIGVKKFNQLFTLKDKEHWALGKASYFGGFCNGSIINKNKIIKNVFAYDINSAYPYVMSNQVVSGDILTTCGNSCTHLYKIIINQAKQIAKVAIIPKLKKQYGFSNQQYEDNFSYQIRYVWEDEICWWEKFYQIDYEIIKKYHFKMTNIFSNYVNDMYKKRISAKKNNDKVNNTRYKIISNSIYGKFAQNYIIRSKVISKCQCSELIKNHCNHLLFNQEYCYQIAVKEETILKNIFTASFITSQARCLLFKQIWSLGDNFIYSDTDSLISKVPLNLKISEEIGDWKLEKYKMFKWIRPKAYIAEKDNGKFKSAVSGLNKDVQAQLFSWDNNPSLKLRMFDIFHCNRSLGKVKLISSKNHLGTSLKRIDFSL